MGPLLSQTPDFLQRRALSLASVPDHMVVDVIYSSGLQRQRDESSRRAALTRMASDSLE